MCNIYKIFSKDWEHILDYSEESMMQLFIYESYGGVKCDPLNGFSVGKKWLNVIVTMWFEDIEKGFLFKIELYDDPILPNWWLDEILKNKWRNYEYV